jgi:cytochrome b561
MAWRNTSERWGALARFFHWAIVLMLIGQFIMAELAEDLPLGMEKIALLARHKSVGITILLLAVLRLGWRALNPTPRAPAGAPWEHALARGAHVALYGLLFAMPLSGWMMSSAKNYPVSWFNLLPLPNLVPVSESIYEFMHETHEVLATTLIIVAAAHVLGALRHHFIKRDDVLKRMLWAATGASLLLGASAAQTEAATAPAAGTDGCHADLAVPARRLDTSTFVFEQAGAATEGRFAGIHGAAAAADRTDGSRHVVRDGRPRLARHRRYAARLAAARHGPVRCREASARTVQGRAARTLAAGSFDAGWSVDAARRVEASSHSCHAAAGRHRQAAHDDPEGGDDTEPPRFRHRPGRMEIDRMGRERGEGALHAALRRGQMM